MTAVAIVFDDRALFIWCRATRHVCLRVNVTVNICQAIMFINIASTNQIQYDAKLTNTSCISVFFHLTLPKPIHVFYSNFCFIIPLGIWYLLLLLLCVFTLERPLSVSPVSFYQERDGKAVVSMLFFPFWNTCVKITNLEYCFAIYIRWL